MFPRKETLWRGAILGGIVNATMTAANAQYASFARWEEKHYFLNSGDGREGVITFDRGHWSSNACLVGVFSDSKSYRHPYRCQRQYTLEEIFRGCPDYQRSLSEQAALPYLREEINGRMVPLITAAFWDQLEFLAAADPWNVAIENGASLIEKELIEDTESAFAFWQNDYQMSGEQVAFAQSLFQRKMEAPTRLVRLSSPELGWLESTFRDPKNFYHEIQAKWADSQRGRQEARREPLLETTEGKWIDSINTADEAQKAMNLCRDLFAGIGVAFPG